MEHEKSIQRINNKYKLIKEEINIITENNIEKVEKKYTNVIKKYDYKKKIENLTNLNRLNEIIYNTYNLLNNNYYNSININNILINYNNNDKIDINNDLNQEYENIIKIKNGNRKIDYLKLFNKRLSLNIDSLEKEKDDQENLIQRVNDLNILAEDSPEIIAEGIDEIILNSKERDENIFEQIDGIEIYAIERPVNILESIDKIELNAKETEENNILLWKESKNLKGINEQIKKENDSLCETIVNQNISIKKLEKEKAKLETEIKELSENLSLKGAECEKNRYLYLKTLKEKESLNKNFIENNNKLNIEIKNKQVLEEKISELKQNLNEEAKIRKNLVLENKDLKNELKDLKNELEDAETIKHIFNEKLSFVSNIMNKYSIKNYKVFNSMMEVDRKDFCKVNPYEDSPQYIGFNVNISAPHMHAYALEYLSEFCTENSRILDIGSGSGYLTFALSAMTNYKGIVVGVEHIQELIDFSINNVRKNRGDLLDNKKIIFVNSDGRLGYKEFGPYKAIHVGAAVEEKPIELLNQLDYNGRMFIPIGKAGKEGNQWIYIIDKDKLGKITYTPLIKVSYGMLTDVDSQIKPKQ